MSSIAIALCSCDGAGFLRDQLASLAAQRRLPDELVISDDHSSDGSIQILRRFASSAQFPVRIISNPVRLGVRGNFEKAIGCSSADLIALCDQDDFWLPRKLSVLHALFENDPEVVAAFSDARVVDDKLQDLGYSIWQHIGFSTERQRDTGSSRPWEVFSKDPVVTGATMIFRRELLQSCLPIPEGWIHDAWIAQIAAAHGKIIAVPEPLVLYRQHAANVIGGKRLSFRTQFQNAKAITRKGLAERESTRYQQLLDRLSAIGQTPRIAVMRDHVAAKLEHLEKRRTLPSSRILRVPRVLSEVLRGNYRRFAKDWRNVAADLLMS